MSKRKERRAARKAAKEKAVPVNQIAEQLPLQLETENGAVSITYPGDVVESLRYMLTRLAKDKVIPSRLAMTSTLREEGTTYLSRALATIIAHDLQASVCVVELNWYWPSRDTAVFPQNLSAVMQNKSTIDEALVATNWPNMFMIPAGQMPPTQRAIITRSENLQHTINELAGKFDHIILDIPAILSTSDAIPLASLGNATCVVIHHGVTPVEKIRQALDEISHLSIIGTVINLSQTNIPARLLQFIPQDK